jgi:hypothetical protein
MYGQKINNMASMFYHIEQRSYSPLGENEAERK